MGMKQRLKGVGIALIVMVITVPMAIIITIVTHSFWLWFEETTAIESYGHSGPAEWCYLAVYFILIVCVIFIWSGLYLRQSRSQ